MPSTQPSPFQWTVQTEAARLVQHHIDLFARALPLLRQLGEQMLAETGTRLVDWVDHLCLPCDAALIEKLLRAGFRQTGTSHDLHWRHDDGIFPLIRPSDSSKPALAIKVDSLADFLLAHRIHTPIQGQPLSPLRTALVCESSTRRLLVIERHGNRQFNPAAVDPQQIECAVVHSEAFLLRPREFADAAEGFRHASKLVDAAKADLGVDRACDLFFAAERRYWQNRNRAAQIQKARQDRLGLGWANHDHHTYRSSRQHFKSLIRLLENLGMVCRERFYGGAQAGWGAQVLEQPVTGIVVFADVDLSPEELMGDFAHDGLAPRSSLGTVGLWCALHGEAILQAGMHHLECQFDFDAARQQLAGQGVAMMPPFTDMPELKQAFTQGEIWPVAAARIEQALASNFITPQQAAQFKAHGSLGSHLEILQRNGGYKGFNQSGISDIIRDTDPRNTADGVG